MPGVEDHRALSLARGTNAPARGDSPHLKLVFAAVVVDQAWKA